MYKLLNLKKLEKFADKTSIPYWNKLSKDHLQYHDSSINTKSVPGFFSLFPILLWVEIRSGSLFYLQFFDLQFFFMLDPAPFEILLSKLVIPKLKFYRTSMGRNFSWTKFQTKFTINYIQYHNSSTLLGRN